jgi:hypothetical protein
MFGAKDGSKAAPVMPEGEPELPAGLIMEE